MKKLVSIFFLLFLLSPIISAQSFYGSEPLAHTYSIVAFDPETGEMGVAVQSHWFSVGTIVSWGEAGVGVIATQSFVNPSFGSRGLEMLKEGKTPQEVVDELLASDDGREVRQLAVLDKNGKAASCTGKNCIQFAGNIVGENFSVQANLMASDKVWPEMAKAFKNSKGKKLADRMLIAMEVAQAVGGDIRGKQSAALLVVRQTPTGNLWEDRVIDIQIADNPEPLKELGRILKVHYAYEHMNKGDLAVEHGDMKLANKEYATAEAMFPDNEEMKYWHAVTLVNNGNIEEALQLFKEVFKQNQNWKTLTPRLVPVGLLDVDEETLSEIMKL